MADGERDARMTRTAVDLAGAAAVSAAGLVGEEGLWAATDVKATRLANEARRNGRQPIVMTANELEWAGDSCRHRQF